MVSSRDRVRGQLGSPKGHVSGSGSTNQRQDNWRPGERGPVTIHRRLRDRWAKLLYLPLIRFIHLFAVLTLIVKASATSRTLASGCPSR